MTPITTSTRATVTWVCGGVPEVCTDLFGGVGVLWGNNKQRPFTLDSS
jgi:hypothetical protein